MTDRPADNAFDPAAVHPDAAPDNNGDQGARDDGALDDGGHDDGLDDGARDDGARDAGGQDDGLDPRAGVTDPRIAAAVARLDGLAEKPPVDHVEVYEEVHRVLQDALADAARASETRDTRADGPGERPGDPRP